MQETAQITTALRYLPWGKHVALVTDGRFSGFSSGACIGHVGPEALHGGPIGRVQDDDLIEIVIDPQTLTGTVDLIGAGGAALDPGLPCCSQTVLRILALHRTDDCPMTRACGRRCSVRAVAPGRVRVYDVDRIVAQLDAASAAAHGEHDA